MLPCYIHVEVDIDKHALDRIGEFPNTINLICNCRNFQMQMAVSAPNLRHNNRTHEMRSKRAVTFSLGRIIKGQRFDGGRIHGIGVHVTVLPKHLIVCEIQDPLHPVPTRVS